MNHQEAQKALEAAQAGHRAAQSDVLVAQARVLEWEAQVMLARAAMVRLGTLPADPSMNGGRQVSNAELREVVLNILDQAGRPLTVDEILTALAVEGVEVPGGKPRSNLQAYLSRWQGIASPRRGRYIPVTVPSEDRGNE